MTVEYSISNKEYPTEQVGKQLRLGYGTFLVGCWALCLSLIWRVARRDEPQLQQFANKYIAAIGVKCEAVEPADMV